MHELGIAQDMVDLITEKAAGARVKRVVLDIGVLSGVAPESMRYCFELCTEDTSLAGVQLDIEEVPGLGRCRACGGQVTLHGAYGRCTCGSSDLEWLSGDELQIRQVELA